MSSGKDIYKAENTKKQVVYKNTYKNRSFFMA